MPAAARPAQKPTAFGTAMIVALFAYNGWWYSTFVADEVRSPRRSIPRSIFAGMSIVLVVYTLANYVYLRVLPFAVLQRAERPAADVMLALVGPGGSAFIVERTDRGFEAYEECRVRISHPPLHYLKRAYYDTVNFNPDALRLALAFAGPRQIVFGIDYPHQVGSIGRALAVIGGLDLPPADRDSLLGGNAARLLRV